MRHLKRSLLMVLVLSLALPAVAEARRPSRPIQWANKLKACAEKGDLDCVKKWEGKLQKLGRKAHKAINYLASARADEAILAAARLSVKLGYKQGADEAALRLKDENFDAKAKLARQLAKLKTPKVVQALCKLTKSRRINERETAVEALEKLGDPAAVPFLVETTKDRFFDVRRKACRALGRFKDPRSVKALGAVLASDGNSGVRKQAAIALGKLNDKTAVPLLIVGLKDKSYPVVDAAAAALKKITGVDLGTDPSAWEGWWKKQ